MANPPRFILNASVLSNWHQKDENHSDQGVQVLKDYSDGQIDLLVDHIRYEITRAIRIAKCWQRKVQEVLRAQSGDRIHPGFE